MKKQVDFTKLKQKTITSGPLCLLIYGLCCVCVQIKSTHSFVHACHFHHDKMKTIKN